MNELDGGLWRAYFRLHAQYCTRCDICLVSAAADAMPRAQDVSSDEEDDDDFEFDPVVVSRTSAEGKMMSKWLTAARKKLGGSFPRPDARAQVDQYAQRLRDYKLKKAKQQGLMSNSGVAPIVARSIESPQNDVFSAATKALATRWIRLARDAIESKRRNKAVNVLGDIEDLLEQMGEEHDWYYTGALRLEGEDLSKEGKLLQENRRVLESEAAIKVAKVELERNKAIHDAEVEIEHERKTYEGKTIKEKQTADSEIEKRLKEIEINRDAKKADFEAQEKEAQIKFGFVPPDLTQARTKRMTDFEEQIKLERAKMLRKYDQDYKESKALFERLESFRKNEIERKKAQATEKINNIQGELSMRIRSNESGWQINALRWNGIARKKIESKIKEEDEKKGGRKTGKSRMR